MYTRVLSASVALFFVVLSEAADSEIKIGNIMPYPGAFSEYGATGRAEATYFQKINDDGGVNGRRIKFISLDSESDNAKAVALAHQLVEQDQVLFTAGIWGTAVKLAIRQYMNDSRVPQLFVAATESAFDDPAHFKWTMGFQPSRRVEGVVYAKYIMQNRPNAKVGILYARGESGEEWLEGIREGFGENFEYANTETVDAGIQALKNSSADVFMNLV